MRYERSFQIGQRELIHFHFSRAVNGGLMGFVGAAVIGMLLMALYAPQGEDSLPKSFLVTMMGSLAFMTINGCLLASYITVVRQVKKGLKEQGLTSYCQTVRVDGLGVHVWANGKEGKVGFDKIFLVRETRKDLQIYLTPTQAWLLPKAQMEDPKAECAQLREYFRAVIEPRRLHLKRELQLDDDVDTQDGDTDI